MPSPPHPYRSPADTAPPGRARRADALGLSARLAGYVVVGFAAVRIALWSVRGLDLAGCIALGVFLVFVASITGAAHDGSRGRRS